MPEVSIGIEIAVIYFDLKLNVDQGNAVHSVILTFMLMCSTSAFAVAPHDSRQDSAEEYVSIGRPEVSPVGPACPIKNRVVTFHPFPLPEVIQYFGWDGFIDYVGSDAQRDYETIRESEVLLSPEVELQGNILREKTEINRKSPVWVRRTDPVNTPKVQFKFCAKYHPLIVTAAVRNGVEVQHDESSDLSCFVYECQRTLNLGEAKAIESQEAKPHAGPPEFQKNPDPREN